MSHSLKGIRVIVTRPEGQGEGLVTRFTELGSTVISMPVISIQPPEHWGEVDTAIWSLRDYDWVVFTSSNGVARFFDRMEKLGINIIALDPVKIACIGPATASALRKRYRDPDAIPPEYISDALPAALGDIHGKKIMLARADIARKEILDELTARGAEVIDVVVYRVLQIEPDNTQEIMDGPAPDVITFTSPSTVRSMWAILQRYDKAEWFAQSRLVCIGPVTSAAIDEIGYFRPTTAENFTEEGLFEAVLSSYSIPSEQE